MCIRDRSGYFGGVYHELFAYAACQPVQCAYAADGEVRRFLISAVQTAEYVIYAVSYTHLMPVLEGKRMTIQLSPKKVAAPKKSAAPKPAEDAPKAASAETEEE